MKRSEWAYLVCSLIVTIALPGCASVRSHQAGNPPTYSDDGLVYRLPKRGINVGVAFEEGKSPVLTVTEGTSFADAAGPIYVARIGRNGVGQTDAEINVTEQGLLSATTAKYTSQIDDFIKALAADAASIATSDDGETTEEEPQRCPTTGTANLTAYMGKAGRFQLDPSGERTVELQVALNCNVKVSLQRAGWRPPPGDSGAVPVPTKVAGYFYRVNMPYVVRAELEGVVKEAVVMLPDESPTYFIELPRALFASTDNTTTFTDGVLTKHKQQTDSELIAALKIPADLLRAYVSALGSFFEAFKSTELKEAQSDTQKVLNELQRQKLEACIIALREDPTGESSDALCAGIAMPSGS
ncbi:hypothetical protein [Agrilutibacter solisilvae]|uniref:Lipoprotein n=1 Tax=Agrilutibacter solisilvae TaxID=2763317 RepID=A0A975AU03_9GAMM|nr:hypothetical protein [Lysobacter solisilvae]QSX79734.1 hypothetical protein I8J32_007830 [Lysobacter solisilvae]